MHLLKEDYNIKVEKFEKKDGSIGQKAYLDKDTSENTFLVKDVLKNKYSALWDKFSKRWYWYVNNEYDLVNKVYPAIDYLISVENNGQSKRDPYQIKKEITWLTLEIDGVIENLPNNDSAEEIKANLEKFKQELIAITNSEEFKQTMGPILKFAAAQGHKYSILNCILIMTQDKDATLVKSKSNWWYLNRSIVPKAPRIWVNTPYGTRHLNAQEKEKATKDFLDQCNVKEVDELNPGEKEELRLLLRKTVPEGYNLQPKFYDIRFTKQIEGKEDLVGDPKAIEELDWYEDGPETDLSKQISNAMVKVILDSGIKLNYATNLGGARGVARLNGTIDVLANTPYNPGFASTLIHEFAHECLHLDYLKRQSKNEWAEYFIEKDQKRGPIEQQAELTAWLVLKGLGINLHQSINYMGCWGLDSTNAVNAFDMVATLANKITVLLKSKISPMNESKQKLHEITGREVAQMLGLTKLYDYGDNIRKRKQRKNKDLNMENKNAVKISRKQLHEAIDMAVNEALENEGAFDFMRGAGSAIGNKFKNAGKRIANNVSNAAKSAGSAISKQYNDVKRAGQMASAEAEINKIINYIQAKAREGVFGKPGDPFYRQVGSSISILRKAAEAKKNQDFGNEE